MYKKNDLFELYLKYSKNDRFSQRLPDLTKKYTIEVMNIAINLCTKWDNFLDIGACSGHYSIPLLHKFRKGTAVEATPNDFLTNLTKEYKNFSVQTGFVQKINFKEKFDFVLMADIFEHIPENDLSSFMIKLNSIQDNNGIVYVLTPNPLFCGPAYESKIFHNGGKLDHEGHYRHYHPNELNRIFMAHGYERLLESYEEGIIRNFFKRYIFSISIRDKRYSNNYLYKITSPLFIWIAKIAFAVVGSIVYRDEFFNRKNDLHTMSYVAIFKKIK